MRFVSTSRQSGSVSFKEALVNGLAVDGGLYMPEHIPVIDTKFWDEISGYSFKEIAEKMMYPYLSDEWDRQTIRELISDAFTFDAPLKKLNDHIFVTELFHGPTLAFKDFGARFMAGAFNKISRDKKIYILVATSGDTGSAVAQSFKSSEHISVFLLYPGGKVSKLQEQQLTTSGGNVTAIEVNGTFDDCQRMVKLAFSDSSLRKKLLLSSANSINFSRLLPQTLYYAYALAQFRKLQSSAPVFSVPSGNMGNVTGGILAMKMGMPVEKFIIATNVNDVVPKYLQNGMFKPRTSIKTISNAMDVGNPSNLARIRYLFGDNLTEMKSKLWGVSFTDDQTKHAIKQVYQNMGYILDPHTAVGYLAGEAYRRETGEKEIPINIMSTAHPAKFKDTVEPLIGREVDVPERLRDCMQKEKYSVTMKPSYEVLKKFLLEQNDK